jgi:hypothetical protein
MQVGLIRQSGRWLLPKTTVNAGTSSEVDVRLSCVVLRGAPDGPHAFDLFDDTRTSRDIVKQVLAFLQFHLSA